MRFFLGTGRYTPNNALDGELAWHPPHVKQWKYVAQEWHRILKKDENRINHNCFVYCNNKSCFHGKNWQYVFNSCMLNIDLETLVVNCSKTSAKYFSSEVVTHSLQSHIISWKDTCKISRDIGPSGRGRNKLRTYRLFKQDYMLENYVNAKIPLKHRFALAKFRCGVAPLRRETGRFESVPEDLRECRFVKMV